MSDYLHAKTENVQKLLDNCLKKQKQELIDKVLEDLDELIAWSSNYPKDSEIFIRLKRKRKKWQGGEKEVVQKRIGDDSFVDKPEPIRLSSNGTSIISKNEGIPSTHSKLPEPCEHINIVPRDDLSYYCKDCGYDTFNIKKDEDGNLTHLLENYEKLQCETCWKSFIWACPLLLNFSKNIVSCSAYEPTDAYLTEQRLILEFEQIGKRIVKQMGKKYKNGNCCGMGYLETLFEREIKKLTQRKIKNE